jgi:hypothetical protein
LAAFYRFYLLQADDHIPRRHEDYFADDATAMAAAKCVLGDFPSVEIWCGPRKVVTLSREEAAQLQPPRITPRGSPADQPQPSPAAASCKGAMPHRGTAHAGDGTAA